MFRAGRRSTPGAATGSRDRGRSAPAGRRRRRTPGWSARAARAARRPRRATDRASGGHGRPACGRATRPRNRGNADRWSARSARFGGRGRYNRRMSERPLSAIVLAAGQGTRMRSARPKPLHMLCGRPLLRYVLDALDECDVDRAVVVVGYAADLVTKKLQENPGPVPLEFVEQRVQRGTGDAVAVGPHGHPRGRPRRPRPGRRRRAGPARRHAADPVRDPGGARPRAPALGRGLHPAHGPDGRPRRLRAHRARPRRPGAPHRRAPRGQRGRAGDRRDQHRHLRVPARACWPRRCAASRPTTPRPSCTSPT